MQFKRPSAAMVMASASLFVALGGGAYAATQIPDGSITHSKLARNSVWHGNVGAGSIQLNNLSSAVRSELLSSCSSGAAGATGPPGPQGPKGDPGPQGPAGTPDVQVFSAHQDFQPNGIEASWCGAPGPTLPGWAVISGGVHWDGSPGSALVAEFPASEFEVWDVQANNVGGAGTVFAVCIKTSQP